MKAKTFLVFLMAVGCFLNASGSNALVEKANKSYADGLYAEAADLYLKVASSGYESPALFYNLGNSYFKMNNYPAAILWLERAKRLDPGNDDIIFNLNVANSKIADKIEPVPEMFYKRWFFGLVNQFSSDQWAWISVILFLSAVGAFTLYLFATRLFFRKAGFWSGTSFLLLFVFALIFAISAYREAYNVREAVIFTPSVTVKSSPDEKSVDLFVIHEGTKVRITDRIGQWNEIKIANGSVGWLPAVTMEQI